MATKYIDRLVSNRVSSNVLILAGKEFQPCLIQGEAPQVLDMPDRIISAGSTTVSQDNNDLMFDIALTDGDSRIVSMLISIYGEVSTTSDDFVGSSIIRHKRVRWTGSGYEIDDVNGYELDTDDLIIDIDVDFVDGRMHISSVVNTSIDGERTSTYRLDMIPNRVSLM